MDEKEMAMHFERLAESASEPGLDVVPVLRRVRRRRRLVAVGAAAAVAVILTGGVAVAQNLARPPVAGLAAPPPTGATLGSPTPTPTPTPTPATPTPLTSPSVDPMLPPLIPSTRASQRRVEEPSCGTSAPGHVLPGTDLNMNSALGLATLHKPPQGAPALTVVLTVTKPVTLENGLLPRFELARRDTEASVAWDVPSLTTMEDGSPLPKGTVTLEPGKEYRMTMHSTPEPCDGETWAGIWSHIGDYRLELSIPRYSVHELTTPPK